MSATAGAVLAVVYLLSEVLAAGTELSEILSKIKEKGNVPQEDWDKLVTSINENEKPWL